MTEKMSESVEKFFQATKTLAQEHAEHLIKRELTADELSLLLFGFAQGVEAAHSFNQIITKLKTK